MQTRWKRLLGRRSGCNFQGEYFADPDQSLGPQPDHFLLSVLTVMSVQSIFKNAGRVDVS